MPTPIKLIAATFVAALGISALGVGAALAAGGSPSPAKQTKTMALSHERSREERASGERRSRERAGDRSSRERVSKRHSSRHEAHASSERAGRDSGR